MEDAHLSNPAVDDIKPPRASVGAVGWLRANLFNSWFNSLLTLVIVYALYQSVIPLIRWAFIDSLYWGTSKAFEPESGWAPINSLI